MRIGITGASGFIGKNLLLALSTESQHQITCLTRPQTSPQDIKFLMDLPVQLTADLATLVNNSDLIYNLAGQIGRFGVTSQQYWNANYNFTKKLISTCRQQKIVHLSSSGVLGPCRNADEQTKEAPSNLYEQTKLAAEQVVENYSDYIIIRPSWVIGPYDLHALPIFSMIEKKRFIQIGSGKQLVQPIYVQDLVNILLQCLPTSTKNETVIAAGEIISFNQLFFLIAHQLDRPLIPIHLPTSLSYLGAGLIEIISHILHINPILRRNGVKFFTTERTYNISKLKHLFSFQPTSIEATIKNTIQYYKTSGLLISHTPE